MQRWLKNFSYIKVYYKQSIYILMINSTFKKILNKIILKNSHDFKIKKIVTSSLWFAFVIFWDRAGFTVEIFCFVNTQTDCQIQSDASRRIWAGYWSTLNEEQTEPSHTTEQPPCPTDQLQTATNPMGSQYLCMKKPQSVS